MQVSLDCQKYRAGAIPFVASSKKDSSSSSSSEMSQNPFGDEAGRKAGLEIWRIENFAPVAYDKKLYGNFFSGDSYIVLRTRLSGQTWQWDVHFWLGKDSSQDEMGAAAMYAVKLDDLLGGTPVQFREVQEHESATFLANFPAAERFFLFGNQTGSPQTP